MGMRRQLADSLELHFAPARHSARQDHETRQTALSTTAGASQPPGGLPLSRRQPSGAISSVCVEEGEC
jgi:hypothetical protein